MTAEPDLMKIRSKTETLKAYIAEKGVTSYTVSRFRKLIRESYRKYGRALPWRMTTDPYNILVSEVMLQQTQVQRVKEKYPVFINRFPDCKSLARASVKDVITVWKGMGYNRRALSLRNTARIVMKKYKGKLPSDREELLALPGIGPATASDILVFAFNIPQVVVETNIRSVFIQFFFSGKDKVTDEELIPLIRKTMDRRDPCTWYNALMDFGVWLKKIYDNPSARSAHYVKQSPFKGSNRQVRSRILTYLIEKDRGTLDEISSDLGVAMDKVNSNLAAMKKEGFINEDQAEYSVKK